MGERFSIPPDAERGPIPPHRELNRGTDYERPPTTLIPEDGIDVVDPNPSVERGAGSPKNLQASFLEKLNAIPGIEIALPQPAPTDFSHGELGSAADHDLNLSQDSEYIAWKSGERRRKNKVAAMFFGAVSSIFGGASVVDVNSVESRFSRGDNFKLEVARSAELELPPFAEINQENSSRANEMITRELSRVGLLSMVERNLPADDNGSISFTAFTDMYAPQLAGDARSTYQDLCADIRGISVEEQKETSSILFDTMYFIPSGAMRAPGSIINPEFVHSDRFSQHYSEEQIKEYYGDLHDSIEQLVVGYFQQVDLDAMDPESRRVSLRTLRDAAQNVFSIEVDRTYMSSLIDRSSSYVNNADYVFSSSDTGDGMTIYDSWRTSMANFSIDTKLLASQIDSDSGDAESLKEWSRIFLELSDSQFKTYEEEVGG